MLKCNGSWSDCIFPAKNQLPNEPFFKIILAVGNMTDLTAILQAGVAAHAWPCVAVAIVKPRQENRIFLAGKHTYASQRTLLPEDLFDLASLNKILVTTTLVAQLYQEGILPLDATVGSIFPVFLAGPQPEWRKTMTVRHLLAHCAGLAPGYPFYRLPWTKRESFREIILQQELRCAPGQSACYSDLGMLLLGEIITEILGQDLATLAKQRIFAPLGLRDIVYCPALLRRPSCVPTELRTDIGEPWQGVVHDENARWLGGIAGHAGLFANIGDLAKLTRSYFYSSGCLLSENTLRLFTRPAGIVPGSSRCLGWDSPSQNSSAGNYISPSSYGHTGFTGTCLWIDPEKALAVILLSNAVYPQRTDKQLAYPHFLRQVYNAVLSDHTAIIR